MESSIDTPSTKSFCTSVPFWLPTNNYYTSSVSDNGEISGSSFSVSYIFCTTFNFELLWPVRFPTYWINYSSSIDLHWLTQLLATHQCVIVIALDFTKAFDTVRHSTLLEKMADLAMPDEVYNWPVSYFHGHRHCTRYDMSSSSLLEISAGIIQGSGIGPASYVVNSSDLTAVRPRNLLWKYADDTYRLPYHPVYKIVDTRSDELANIEEWSRKNNLTLNRSNHRKLFSLTGGGSVASNTHHRYLISIVSDSRSYCVGQLICVWTCRQRHHILCTKRSGHANTSGICHGS